jgi:hypothetical protein
MVSATVIVMERTGDWAVALRRHLHESTARLIETRSLDECWQRLGEWPEALVVWELTDSNLRALIAALLSLQREFPQATAVVVAERRLVAWAELIREAGAIHFVSSPRAISAIADIVSRRASRPSSVAYGRQSLMETNDDALAAIWAELPWSDIV